MLRSKAVALLALAICLLFAGTAAEADAKEAPDPPPVFSLDAAGGYRIVGLVGGPQNRPARLDLIVGNGNEGVIYSSFPATYDEETGAISSDLGALGSVALTFHATGGSRRVQSHCGGEGMIVPSGFFEGSVVFRGEHEYTGASAGRARLEARFLVDLFCPGYSEVTGMGKGAALNAHGRSVGGARVSLEAIKNGARKGALISAGIRERVGGVRISRSVGIHARSGAFAYQPSLGGAVVSPPAPFSGSARFTGGPGSGSWLGSLSVDFPGRPDVALAGSGFDAGLRHAHYDLYRP